MARRKAARPRLALRLAVTVGAPLLGLCLVELALRALDLGPPPPPEVHGALFRASTLPGVGFDHQPGAVQQVHYRERAGDEPRVVEMRVNADGLRGAPVERPKRPGSLRIACLGDSHTFGWGVGEGEAWPDQLARELERRRPDVPFEVLNCGVNNWDTVQEVAFLEHALLPLEPDLVVLQFFVNDAAVRGAERARPPRRDPILRWTRPGSEGWLGELRARSRFADLLCDGIWRRRGLGVYSDDRTAFYADDEPGWVAVQGALRRARELCAERGIALLVALYPFPLRRGDVLASHEAFRRVQDVCAREGIPCADAEPAFLGVELSSLRVSPHDYHGGARAHALFAGVVARALEEGGMLDAPAR